MKNILELNPAEYSIIPALFIKLIQLVVAVYSKFVRDAGFARAGNLAFSTLMSAIPFATLILALLNAFGALDTMQNMIMDFLLQMLLPTRQEEIKGILEGFLANSNTLGVVGLGFFAFTSIMLLNSVNVNLNEVWGSRVKTNFINKFTTYAAVIIFGTLLVAASTTLSSRFSFTPPENLAVFTRFLIKVAPFIFDFLVILLLIGLTPSGKIQLRYLVPTSIVGAFAWELLKYGFFNLSSWALRMSVIYGTLAVIPIFLFWIDVIWMIILFTMETTWVLQHKKNVWMGKDLSNMTPEENLAFGMEIFLRAARAFEFGEKPLTIYIISNDLSVPLTDVQDMTDILVSADLLMLAGEDAKSIIPKRSLNGITTADVIGAIYGHIGSDRDAIRLAAKQVDIFSKAGMKAVENYNIANLLRNNPSTD